MSEKGAATKWGFICIIIVIVSVSIAYILTTDNAITNNINNNNNSTNNNNNVTNSPVPTPSIEPRFVITNYYVNTKEDFYVGLVQDVYVSVRNNGVSGTQTIYCAMRSGGNTITKNYDMYLASGETRTINFTFEQIYSDSVDVWVESLSVR
ncbi:MAG: hypothetical protein LBE76_08765 [Nitrososphaerota archaeon]|jgi:hypothetical protein|nr:hypothetical protein [Nitrososphaerota archaeon]